MVRKVIYQGKRMDPTLYFVAARPASTEGYLLLNDGHPIASLKKAQDLCVDLPEWCEPLVLVGSRPHKSAKARLARRVK